MDNASHAELVARPADRAAEAEICRRFAPRIRLYGLKHLRDDDRASELVQRVLVGVIEAVRGGRIEEPEHLDRYVLGMARNMAARLRASEAKAEAMEPARLDELGLASIARFDAVDVAPLLDCISKLDARSRTILQLAYYRDRTADEIAAALEMTAGNVRVVRHRAMVALRGCMERTAA
jgi:RNA polymerase sigma-70 factor (ECF subfamily)